MFPAQLLKRVRFVVPPWASHLAAPKHGRVLLGHLPTPLMPWACPALKELGVQWTMKRDDLSGLELSGNKVRKLELLMAEALAGSFDCVVTVGGLQSNHCRATAAAARLVDLEPHLVLVVGDAAVNQDPGLKGNLLVDRLLGAKIHLCAASDYRKCGGDLTAMDKLSETLAAQLRAEGRRPFVVPVGGSTAMSAWAYIQAVDELCAQATPNGDPSDLPFDHIVFAAGTGGTATGIALGCHLAGVKSKLHGVNIQHTPELYYETIKKEVGVLSGEEHAVEQWLCIHNGAGAGYGRTTPEQLSFIKDVATSGVLLDPVYTGKALHTFCDHALAHPSEFRGARILFWHTGGLFGLAAMEERLASTVHTEQVQQLCL